MITYLEGDATDIPAEKRPAIIAHVCNDRGVWGAGFVLAISKKWPEPEKHYKHFVKNRRTSPLGQVQFVPVDNSGLIVANMIAQRGFPDVTRKRALDYIALADCLKDIGSIISVYNKRSIHMPRIGCGIAGGDWNVVEALIEDALPKVQVYVYDLPKKGT